MSRRSVAVALVAVLAGGVPVASAIVPEGAPELPLLADELVRGGGQAVEVAGHRPPAPKVVDGDPSDWTGDATGFGGTAVYSAGEFVYQDHLFDARGADDGGDADRLELLDPLRELEPRSYRLEPLIGQDPPSQFGFDTPEPLKGEEWYGDAGLIDVADLVEARVAAHGSGVAILARTTTMATEGDTAVLLLVDSAPGGSERAVPFGSGLTTQRAETAVLLAGDRGWVADLATGALESLPAGSVATDASGWRNSIEARLTRQVLGAGSQTLEIALAAGRFDDAGGLAPLFDPDGAPLASNVANVAFRNSERVRSFFERGQALALHDGSVDEFFAAVDLERLRGGDDERFVPGPGYHDRIFVSAEGISDERQMDGVWQHYGLYLPDDFTPGETYPLQWWLHWRGGHAHSAASVIPRMFRTLGDGEAESPVTGIGDSIVVAPRGRGTSNWYVGIGHADFLEVWDDVFDLMGGSIDDRRVYVTGHSMGGFGSYLLAVLYPDRFAASFPYSGPVTQGAWTGLDFPTCDNWTFDEYSFCYIQANSGDARAQHTRRLLENLHNVPIAVFQGAADELVPTSGVVRQAEQLTLLGQRHRLYLFPNYEHFSFPIVDEWTEGGRYAHRFETPDHPARVRYVRDGAFERATEQSRAAGREFDFSFDAAYWMRGLEIAEGADAARFDGRSLAIPDDTVVAPEAGGPTAPGQSGPYVMEGLQWVENPLGSPSSNGFAVTLEGASSVELDLAGMSVSSDQAIGGTVTTDTPLTLRLDGGFDALPVVSCDCAVALDGGVLTLQLSAGTSDITIG